MPLLTTTGDLTLCLEEGALQLMQRVVDAWAGDDGAAPALALPPVVVEVAVPRLAVSADLAFDLAVAVAGSAEEPPHGRIVRRPRGARAVLVDVRLGGGEAVGRDAPGPPVGLPVCRRTLVADVLRGVAALQLAAQVGGARRGERARDDGVRARPAGGSGGGGSWGGGGGDACEGAVDGDGCGIGDGRGSARATAVRVGVAAGALHRWGEGCVYVWGGLG